MHWHSPFVIMVFFVRFKSVGGPLASLVVHCIVGGFYL
jgi:hypothetical protein